jgi:hypothetical protein
MSTTPYNAGQKNAGHTDAPPSYSTLKNSGLSDTKAAEWLRGYSDAKGDKK